MRENGIGSGMLRQDSAIRSSFIWSGVFTVLTWILTVGFYWRLPPQIPLFYSLVRGEEQLTIKPWVLLLPMFSLMVWLLHMWVARIHYKTEAMLSRITATTSMFVTFLLLVALAHVIIIVM